MQDFLHQKLVNSAIKMLCLGIFAELASSASTRLSILVGVPALFFLARAIRASYLLKRLEQSPEPILIIVEVKPPQEF